MPKRPELPDLQSFFRAPAALISSVTRMAETLIGALVRIAAVRAMESCLHSARDHDDTAFVAATFGTSAAMMLALVMLAVWL